MCDACVIERVKARALSRHARLRGATLGVAAPGRRGGSGGPAHVLAPV